MAKNRYKDTAPHRLIEGRMRVLEAVNRKLYRVEIWALNDRTTGNNWRFINLEAHLKEFQDIPILTAYLKNGRVIGDGHNYEVKVDPRTGKEYASFTAPEAERIVGWVPKDANIRLEKKDGTSWIVVTGYLWSWYSHELVEKIVRQGDGSPINVSIEALVTKEHKDGDVDVEEEYIVLGITVLGDGVAPAVAGANIQSLAALRDGMKKEILKAASYCETQPHKHETDKGVTKMPITPKVLKKLGENFSGYTCVGASDDRARVALLSENGTPFGYSYQESDKGTVIQERIREASARVIFAFDGAEVEAPLETVMERENARVRQLEADLKAAKSAEEKLSGQVETMQAREKARRLQAAKDAIKAELALRNENRSDDRRFSTELCKELGKRVENNEFTDMEDKDGNWTGEQAVRSAVAALCMDEQTRMDKAEKAKERHLYNWTRDNSTGKTGPQTLGELIEAENAE